MKGWKVTAIGVVATALVAGLVIMSRIDGHRSARRQATAQPVPARVGSTLAIPSPSDVNACNKYAASEVATLEGGAIPAAGGGSVYGLDESKKQDERYRVAYAGCMRARGFAS